MRILGLDIGTRRTGAALLDESIEVPLGLDSIEHETGDELIAKIHTLAEAKHIDSFVLGLPLLPSGTEGSQAELVRSIANRLMAEGLTITLLDERYTTPRHPHANGDMAAACELLLIYQNRDVDKA